MVPSLPVNSNVRKSALPIRLPGGPDGILIIHGFTGFPGEHAYLAQRFNEAGFTVSAPRLSGHGTNGQDFVSTGDRDWLRSAIDAYLELAGRCERVCVAGHSMGGVIASILAGMFKPAKLVLMAPAHQTRGMQLRAAWLFHRIIRSVPSGQRDPSETADDAYYFEQYRRVKYLGPSASLYRLQRLAISRLPLVTSDTLTIVSRKDTTVPLSVLDMVEKGISSVRKEHLILDESLHSAIPNGCEKEKVADAMIAWCTETAWNR